MNKKFAVLQRNKKICGCPICGFQAFEAFDSFGLTTYDICSCCGFQSGYTYGEDVSEETFLELRRIWVNELGAVWRHCTTDLPPTNWNYKEQLRLAKLKV